MRRAQSECRHGRRQRGQQQTVAEGRCPGTRRGPESHWSRHAHGVPTHRRVGRRGVAHDREQRHGTDQACAQLGRQVRGAECDDSHHREADAECEAVPALPGDALLGRSWVLDDDRRQHHDRHEQQRPGGAPAAHEQPDQAEHDRECSEPCPHRRQHRAGVEPAEDRHHLLHPVVGVLEELLDERAGVVDLAARHRREMPALDDPRQAEHHDGGHRRQQPNDRCAPQQPRS